MQISTMRFEFRHQECRVLLVTMFDTVTVMDAVPVIGWREADGLILSAASSINARTRL